jgi:(1->4)-alpha-D-glucan 1-alpha-D-glucosylmutase
MADRPRRRGRRARVVPTSTYRLQLRPGFGFDEAAAVAPYLARLGVSHVYASPYLQATPGSAHGYDVVDPHRVNVELGGARGHRRFQDRLGELGLGQVLDIVPNHMAITSGRNPWWWDVLENGPSSRYARYFDVDWDPPEAHLRDLVLIPILGDHYGRVLEAGEIRLERHGGAFQVRYHEHALPVAPRSLDAVLGLAAARVRSAELAALADALEALPPATAVDRSSVLRRHRDKEVLRRLITRLLGEQPRTAAAVDGVLAETNGDADALDAILSRQNYRLAHWRAADRDLGYRRFFDVSGLVGLRVEDDAVFADSHALVLRWLAAGVLDGLRVDHPDGLADPVGYVQRLRSATPRGWLIVEKILEDDEGLRADWPVDGTTGYDGLASITELLVDPAAEPAFTALLEALTGEDRSFEAIAREARRDVLHGTLGSELNRLTANLLDIVEGHRRYRDYTRHELHEVLREVAAAFPVYRTYVRPAAGVVDPLDVAAIESAVAAASEGRPDLDPDLFGFLADILTLRIEGPLESELVRRFQQLTGAVMAKGIEDTAFYRYHRLVALNEVGGHPGRFGSTTARFHERNARRQARWPASMVTTATHDTKRGEDVRARIAVLSEVPARWRSAVRRWWPRFEAAWPEPEPFDPSLAYFAAQTLVGAWPIEAERLEAYLLKSAREAKLRTSWTAADERYEAAVSTFSRRIVADRALTAAIHRWLPPVRAGGRLASLGQTLLRLTVPGVPDTYQGTELWDDSLVDPDNRRPVDLGRRATLLAELEDGLDPSGILARVDEGLPKLWTIRQALHLRRSRPEAFDHRGTYRPLHAAGAHAGHVVAFSRGDSVITVVPRHGLRLSGGRLPSDLRIPSERWGDTAIELPPGRWHDHLGGGTWHGRVTLADLLAAFPLALLAVDDAG